MSASWKLIGVLGFVLVAAGARLPAASNPATDAVPANPTFTRDVLPIFQKSCQDCHRPGQMAPFSLLSYEDARPWARSIKDKVVSRYMPPWHLDRTVGEYSPDPSLSNEQVATIAKWVDTGAPKGDPKDAPAPRVFPADNTWQFGEEPDLIVNGPAVDVPAVAADMYPRPEVPSGMTEDRYIKWIQVIPEQTKVVHHVLVFARQSESANGTLIRGDSGGFGGRGGGRGGAGGGRGGAASGRPPGVTAMLTEYARGNDGDVFDNGQAKLLKKDATITFEIHLHPNGESAVTEHTKVGIKFFPKDYKPKHLIVTHGIMSPNNVMIPPMEPNARSDSYFPLAEPARLVSYQPHMHYRGKRMMLEAILPNGQTQLLTDVNRFVWTWQITYPYKDQPAFPKGTVLHSIAYHDNSPGNKENPDPSAFIGWGDRTVDEMNIGWLDFYYISEEEYAEVQKEKRARATTTAGVVQ